MTFPVPTFRPKGTASPTIAKRHVLGVISHDTAADDPAVDSGHPILRVHTARGENMSFQEVWSSDRPVQSGYREGLCWGYDGEVLFVAGRIAPVARYTAATRDAYQAALRLADDFDCRHLVRMWNYVSDINVDNTDGLEIYRDFCRGRAEAFDAAPFAVELPAATGVGAVSGGIGFYLLAAREVHRVNLENPRQTPAFWYPLRYGPRSPSFPRATVLRSEETVAEKSSAGKIFVSGTASVRGCETVHAGDIRGQCAETFENLAALLDLSNLKKCGLRQGYPLADMTDLKVYVRNADDIDIVQKLCAEQFSPTATIAFLNIDLCRSDLLVEIEGIVHDPDMWSAGRATLGQHEIAR